MEQIWKLADLPPSLESGDPFSLKGKGVLGWAARHAFTPYTEEYHFGLLWYRLGDGDWVILESVGKGIAVGRLSFYQGKEVVFYRVNCDAEIRHSVCEEMTLYGRSPYDYELIAKLVVFGSIKWASVGFRKLTADELPYSADTQFECIEAVDMAYWLKKFAIIPKSRMPIPSAMKQAELEGRISEMGRVGGHKMNKIEPKPDESRLLTIETLAEIACEELGKGDVKVGRLCIRIRNLQDATTASILNSAWKGIVRGVKDRKEAECQRRIGEIVKDLDSLWHKAGELKELERLLGDYIIALKKQEDIESSPSRG